MTHDTDDGELAELRRRAYGPDADIQSDPGALQRLRELEAALHPAAPIATTGAGAADAPTTAAGDADEAGGPGEDEAPEAAPSGAAEPVAETAAAGPDGPAKPRRVTALVLAAALLIAFAGIGTGVAVARQRVPASAHRVASLHLDRRYDTARFAEAFRGGDASQLRAFTLFHGLRSIVMPNDDGQNDAAADSRCLIVFAEDSFVNDPVTGATNITGAYFFGCGAGAFPPTASNTVDEPMPQAVRSAFPKQHTALQFAYDARRQKVDVFADR